MNTVVISDVHIGNNYKTCWYQKAVHEPYLTAVLDGVIDRAGSPGFHGSARYRGSRASRRPHHSAAGLPIGLQIVGPRFAEPKILATAKLVHEVNPTAWPPTIKAAARS